MYTKVYKLNMNFGYKVSITHSGLFQQIQQVFAMVVPASQLIRPRYKHGRISYLARTVIFNLPTNTPHDRIT